MNKTDKNDARIIAEITRLHSCSDIMNLEVHVKEQYCSEVISMIRCREALVQQNIDTYNRVRAVLRTHGFPIENWSPIEFIKAITKMILTLPFYIAESIKAVFASYEAIVKQIERLDKIIAIAAEQNSNAQLLMTIPEIGPLTALYLAVLIDDPKRFKEARDMGSYLGLTPSQYSSGEKTLLGSISKKGDAFGRKLLVSAARRILQKNKKKF